MTEISAKTPQEIVKEDHSDYYSAGSYSDDR
jgi:hypothetical protein